MTKEPTKNSSEVGDAKEGHRQRLRQRFLKDHGDSMEDYELLELLLMTALPRRDVKPLAKRLLSEFGSFAYCIQASPEALRSQPDCGESVIVALKLVQASALRLLREEAFESGHILNAWDKVLDYCQALLAREKSEQLRGLFLNYKNHLISDELLNRGTIDQAPFYPREIIRRALDLGAGAMILVHNHPSGDASPSREDIEATLQLRRALDVLDIDLHDHVIVSKTHYVSMRSKGILA